MGFMNDQSVWILMLEKRNRSVAIYGEDEINKLISLIRDSFIPVFASLGKTLEE